MRGIQPLPPIALSFILTPDALVLVLVHLPGRSFRPVVNAIHPRDRPDDKIQ